MLLQHISPLHVSRNAYQVTLGCKRQQSVGAARNRELAGLFLTCETCISFQKRPPLALAKLCLSFEVVPKRALPNRPA